MKEKTNTRENFLLDEETANTFRMLVEAEGISKTDLFRKMVRTEAEANKELLETWKRVTDLREK